MQAVNIFLLSTKNFLVLGCRKELVEVSRCVEMKDSATFENTVDTLLLSSSHSVWNFLRLPFDIRNLALMRVQFRVVSNLFHRLV